jgi:HEAT repeat protein
LAVSEGLKTTFEVLGKTHNDAASAALLPCLDSQHAQIQDQAIRAIMERRSPQGQREILARWHSMSERWRAIVEERPNRMEEALHESVQSFDAQKCHNACSAILALHEYELMPALLAAVETPGFPHVEQTAQTALALAAELYDELAGPRDYSIRRDPQVVRRNMVQSLEASVNRFPSHGRVELVEGFLLLVNRDNVTLKQTLMDPTHVAHATVIDLMSHSDRGGVLRLVLGFLDDPQPPRRALAILSQRTDLKFLRHLCDRIADEPSPTVTQNLHRLDDIRWADPKQGILDRLGSEEQEAAVELLMATGLHRQQLFQVVQHLLRNGDPPGRRAAAKALSQFSGPESNVLALEALSDSDAGVQARILKQLRARSLPGALQQLIDHLDNSDPEVQQAARDGLSEFTFSRYIKAFDSLTPAVREKTGVLVRKVDLAYAHLLSREMESPARTRRLRALAATAAMRVVDDVLNHILDMLGDQDHVVRVEAVQTLAYSDLPRARIALREAMSDGSPLVQQAAERSLLEIQQRLSAQSGTTTSTT